MNNREKTFHSFRLGLNNEASLTYVANLLLTFTETLFQHPNQRTLGLKTLEQLSIVATAIEKQDTQLALKAFNDGLAGLLIHASTLSSVQQQDYTALLQSVG